MAGQSFDERYDRFMRGRNGMDELGACSLGIAVVLMLAHLIGNVAWLGVVQLAFAGYTLWRMLSRQVSARRAENRAFVSKLGPVAPWLRNPVAAFKEARAYKHFTCPSCHQRVRVPRGKGRLRVTCPSCHTKFEARS